LSKSKSRFLRDWAASSNSPPVVIDRLTDGTKTYDQYLGRLRNGLVSGFALGMPFALLFPFDIAKPQ
jgi:hypothetical protein